MLEKPVMFIFMMILLVFFMTGGIVVIGGAVKWYQLSTQSHILVNIMARHGYYNETAEESLQEFCKRSNIKRSELNVNAIPTNSYDLKTYGETVRIQIDYTYKKTLTVGSMLTLFEFPIKAPAAAVSTCVPGLYVVP